MRVFESELTGSLKFNSQGSTLASITPGSDLIGITGSLYVTGSDIFLNGFPLVSTINSLLAGDSPSISVGLLTQASGGLMEHSASMVDFSQSAAIQLTDLIGLSGSIEAFNNNSSSYFNSASISSSVTTGGSTISTLKLHRVDGNIHQVQIPGVDSYDDLINVPFGIISSSAQLSELGFLTSSRIEGVVSVDTVASVVDSFNNVDNHTVFHGFDTKNVLVQVYDDSDNSIIPLSIRTTSVNSVSVTFSNPTSGRVVVGKAGHVFPFPFTGSFFVSSSFIDETNSLRFINGASESIDVDLSGLRPGDGVISSSAQIAAMGYVTNATISGSSVTIEEVAVQSDTFTNSTSYTAFHNFGTNDVIVNVYDQGNNIIIPQNIKNATTNSLEITFSDPTSGRVVIGKAGHVVPVIPTGSFFSSASIESSGTVMRFHQRDTQVLDVNVSKIVPVSSSHYYKSSSFDGQYLRLTAANGTKAIDLSSLTTSSGSAFVTSGSLSGSDLILYKQAGNISVDLSSFNNDTSAFATTASNHFKATQYFTGSLVPEATSTGNGIHDLGSIDKPWKDLYLTTSSLKFIRNAQVVASVNGEADGIRIGNIFIGTGSISVVSGSGDSMTTVSTVVNSSISGGQVVTEQGDTPLPSNIVSSSIQIASLGFITSSITALPSGTISSSAQIAELGYITSSISALPSGTISSSAQITALGFVTSSVSSLSPGIISSSAQLEALGVTLTSGSSTNFSGSTSFNGSTSFTGSSVISGSLTVIDNQGFSVVGNTSLSGSNTIEGTTTVIGNSLTVNTPLTVNNTSSLGPASVTGSLVVTGDITADNLTGTASLASNSELFDGKDSATFATTGSNIFKASQYISGSVVIAPSDDPGTSNVNATYLFTSASNFGEDECDFYYRNKGILWDQEWIEQGVNSGLIYGGVVTYQASTLYISPGGGLVVNHNASTSSAAAAVPTQVKWGPITSSVTYLTSSQYSHIFIDENGNLQQQVDNFTPEQYLQKIPLGTLGHLNNATIDSFGEEKQTVYASSEQSNQFIRAFGPLKQQGYDLSASGSSLGFNSATGTTYRLGGFYSKNPNNPSLFDTPALESTGRVVRVYKGTGDTFVGDINAGNFYDTIDPTKYDDGSGTLVNISGSTTTVQRVYIGATSYRYYVYYGQETYDSIATALNNLTTEAFTESITTSKSLTFIGYIVAQANATDLSDTSQANIVNAGLFRNTAGSSGGGTSTISNLGDITDVNFTSLTTGEYLKYNAGVWENSAIQYSEASNIPSGIVSSSAQLEALGVTLASGGTTEFAGNVVVSGSAAKLTVDGDIIVSGSLSSPVISTNVSFYPTGWTAIFDCTKGNFFETTLRSGITNFLSITGGSPGQTINIKITQHSTNPGTISWSSDFNFADGASSAASTGVGDVDIFSAITFDGSNWYVTGLKNFS